MKLRFKNISSQLDKHRKSRILARTDKGELLEFHFDDLLSHVEILSKYLTDKGVDRKYKIGLQSANCYEWLVWDLTALKLNIPIIAFPDDADIDPVSTSKKYDVSFFALGNHALRNNKNAKYCLPIDIFLTQPNDTSATTSFMLATPEKIESHPEDLYSQVFSSGTSGHIKGLNISRKGSEFLVNIFNERFQVNEQDSTIIFLPLANYQQRLIAYSCIATGADFCITDIQGVFFQLLQFKPTFLIAPPVIYEKVLLMAGAQSKEQQHSKLRESLGGNTRFLITGMAPIKHEVIEQYLDAEILLLEAYGVTETGLIAFNTPDSYKVGSVGQPLVAEHIRFGKGNEIIIKRPYPLSLGYFECKPSENKDTFLSHGEIATGDIGEYSSSEGFLHLRGRKKDIIVTSAGVKLHPSQLEQDIHNQALFEQVAVFYSNASSQLTAILVVPQERDSEILRQVINSHFKHYNDSAASYKKITKWVVTHEDFSPKSNTLTKNLKLNRSVIQTIYDSM